MKVIIPFILIIPIFIILIDHAYRHNGNFFDSKDFEDAYLTAIKSHEGFIFMILLVILGVLIGGFL